MAKDETWYIGMELEKYTVHVCRTKLSIAPNAKPQNILSTSDHAVRARMRKLLGTSFSANSLRSQQPTIESFADLLIDRLRTLLQDSEDQSRGVVVDMVDWINYFTVDVIGDLAVGESFNCLRNSDYHPWVKTLFNYAKGIVLAAATRFYPAVEWLFRMALPRSVMELQRKHTEFMDERIHRRLNLKTDRPDFLTPLMKDNANYENMSLGEIESTFAVIIAAGSETTATSLCGTLNHLVKPDNKAALEMLVCEIRGTFMREQDITIEATKHLTYLEAVINEGLRICNPVPGGFPRVVPKGGDTYAGYFVPEKVYCLDLGYDDMQSTILTLSRLLSPCDRTSSTIQTISSLQQTRSSLSVGCQRINGRRDLRQITSQPATPLAWVQQAVLAEILRGPRCGAF